MPPDIQFETDKVVRMPQSSSSSKMEDWLQRKGIAKSKSAAQSIMIGVVVLNIILAIVIYKIFT